MQQHICQNIKRDRQMIVDYLAVIADELLGGISVEISASGIDLFRNLLGGPVCGALEQHVLNEMRDAVFRHLFTAGACADPESDARGANMRHRFRYHSYAVR